MATMLRDVAGMKGLLRRAAFLGVEPATPASESKYIVVTNALAMVTAVLSLPQLPLTVVFLPPSFVVLHVLVCLAAVLPLWFNARGWHLLASCCFGYLSLFSLVGMAWLAGRDAGLHFYLFLHAVGPFLYFSDRHRAPMFGLATLSTLALVGLAMYFEWVDPAPAYNPDALVSRIFFSFAIPGLYLSLIAFGLYSRLQTRRVEGLLEERNAELSDALASLKETQTKLVLTQKLVSLADLVAGVAHELNTPLGAMKSSATSAERALARLRKKPDDRLLDILGDTHRVIGDATERVVEVVDMLRSFARLDGADWQIANVDTELERTLKLTRHRFEEGVTIVEDYGGTPDIRCRPRQLNQLFANLLVNAAEAMAPDGTVILRTELREGRVRVEVIDDGVGIEPTDLERVFDPGFTKKGVGVGVGLGLAVAYSIATEQGGTLEIESEGTGLGTVARVSLRLPSD